MSKALLKTPAGKLASLIDGLNLRNRDRESFLPPEHPFCNGQLSVAGCWCCRQAEVFGPELLLGPDIVSPVGHIENPCKQHNCNAQLNSQEDYFGGFFFHVSDTKVFFGKQAVEFKAGSFDVFLCAFHAVQCKNQSSYLSASFFECLSGFEGSACCRTNVFYQ